MTIHSEHGNILNQTAEITLDTPLQDVTLELLVTPKADFISNSIEPSNCTNGHVYVHALFSNNQFIRNRHLMIEHFPYGPNFLENIQDVVASGDVYIEEEGTVRFLVAITTDRRYVVLEIINNMTFTLLEVEKPQDYRYLGNWPNLA